MAILVVFHSFHPLESLNFVDSLPGFPAFLPGLLLSFFILFSDQVGYQFVCLFGAIKLVVWLFLPEWAHEECYMVGVRKPARDVSDL